MYTYKNPEEVHYISYEDLRDDVGLARQMFLLASQAVSEHDLTTEQKEQVRKWLGFKSNIVSITTAEDTLGYNITFMLEDGTFQVAKILHGKNGKDGVGIERIETTPSEQAGSPTHITVWGTDGSELAQFDVYNGKNGRDGKGITRVNISQNNNPGEASTVSILNTDGTSQSFKVYNGKNGKGIKDVTAQSNSISRYTSVTVYTTDSSEAHTFNIPWGSNGQDGVGIAQIIQSGFNQQSGEATFTVEYTNGTSEDFTVGTAGRGIASVVAGSPSRTGSTPVKFTFTDGTSQTINMGTKGDRGYGIDFAQSVTGQNDTKVHFYAENDHNVPVSTVSIPNGAKGERGKDGADGKNGYSIVSVLGEADAANKKTVLHISTDRPEDNVHTFDIPWGTSVRSVTYDNSAYKSSRKTAIIFQRDDSTSSSMAPVLVPWGKDGTSIKSVSADSESLADQRKTKLTISYDDATKQPSEVTIPWGNGVKDVVVSPDTPVAGTDTQVTMIFDDGAMHSFSLPAGHNGAQGVSVASFDAVNENGSQNISYNLFDPLTGQSTNHALCTLHNGQDGIGIKDITQSADLRTLNIKLTNGITKFVNLPVSQSSVRIANTNSKYVDLSVNEDGELVATKPDGTTKVLF